MLSVLKRFFVFGFGLLVLSAAAGFLLLDRFLHQPLKLDKTMEIAVDSGSNLTRVVYQLVERQVLELPWVVLAYARLSGRTEIQAGEYRLAPGITPQVLLDKLNSGDVIYYQVAFPEGLTVREWQLRLQQQANVSIELENAELPFIEGSPEGWLYPDTYRFRAGESDRQLLQRAHRAMREVLDRQWRNRAGDLPYKNPYEALIMASIIEKETGAAEEREKIAGVFVRRLQRGMRLQTDPTVIYGLGDSYDGNLTRKHLRQKTAYNTYVIRGLPPTPIANPGEAAIYAALHPADGNELFFVAKGDGSHHFSATLAEHQQAVQKYQRSKRRRDYRSSPKL